MKPSSFFWAWNDAAPTEDKLMNRGRAAKLIRSWRRSTRPANYRPMLSVQRLEKGVFLVRHECGETGKMIVE